MNYTNPIEEIDNFFENNSSKAKVRKALNNFFAPIDEDFFNTFGLYEEDDCETYGEYDED